MLNIKFIRENKDIVREGIIKKGINVDIDKILKLDEEKRRLIKNIDNLRMKKNDISGCSGEAVKIKSEIQVLENELKQTEEKFYELMFSLPNLPLDDVPIGKDEKENVVLREIGKKPDFDFKPCDYLTLAEKLDLIDIERAAKVSGSRFGYLKKEIVMLEFALIQLVFEFFNKQEFIPVIPPVMIKEEMMKGMGFIDTVDDKKERYFLEKDKLYLVGTAEQSVGPMHANEIFKEDDLPRRYIAFSTCFRREAGSYGKDTKGILRVHQFDKIEMVSFVLPNDSKQEHKFLLNSQEKLMQLLNLPYRVVHLCTGDLSKPSASTYDIETWLPGQNQYRETHSTSNITDFQARRLNIKFRRGDGETKFVHMLNGTAFAIGRIIIAIIENYQQKNGDILVPQVLQKYTGFTVINRKL